MVGDVYERDFAIAAVGAPTTVSFAAYPDMQLTGKVAYIDPPVKADTRTAQVRIEVPNPKGQLRLGMLAEVRLQDSRVAPALTIPRAALQTIGGRTVVYVADPAQPTRFVERDVSIDAPSGGDMVESFPDSRAERLSLRRGASHSAPSGTGWLASRHRPHPASRYRRQSD